jgi:signal transduction histidine kinase
MNLNLCLDAVPGFLNFFDLSVAPPLLFYAYIPILVISLFFSIFIFARGGGSALSKYFLGINLAFAAWIFLILFQWTGAYLETVHLAWQLLLLPEALIYIFSVFFTYVFIFKKDIPDFVKILFILLLTVLAIILPTQLNVESFDLINCEGVVGAVWPYVYVFELITIALVIVLAIERLFAKVDRMEKVKNFFFALGMVVFLGIFWASNYFGELTQTYEINLVGPIGMFLFLSLMAYLIVRFRAFNVKLIGTQVLIVTIWVLVLGILFIQTIENVRIITALTLILVTIAGDLLIKSVIKEVKQREELARLNAELKDLIKQRESLVHLVTHKVKGSFTRSKYIFAGLLDGTFGPITPEIKKYAEQGLESNDMGIETVDLVLNADNLQKGIVKYDMKPFDMKEIVHRVILEKEASVKAKGLTLESNLGEGNFNVLGDSFWIKEVANNLIENSIKYTPKGKITVSLEDGNGKVKLSVKDTGVGLTPEDRAVLFTEGGRGKDSVKINVDSTGYGLYSVKLILDAHKGRAWAESEGPGKGSQFYVELDALEPK